MKSIKTVLCVVSLAVLAAAFAGCDSEADTSSRNLSIAAENFEIDRRVVFFNGITDKYLLSIEGRCSVETTDGHLSGALEVTCKIARDTYKKHFLGLSDNVSYFVEQISDGRVSGFRNRVIFRPQTIVPDIDLQTSGNQSTP